MGLWGGGRGVKRNSLCSHGFDDILELQVDNSEIIFLPSDGKTYVVTPH